MARLLAGIVDRERIVPGVKPVEPAPGASKVKNVPEASRVKAWSAPVSAAYPATSPLLLIAIGVVELVHATTKVVMFPLESRMKPWVDDPLKASPVSVRASLMPDT